MNEFDEVAARLAAFWTAHPEGAIRVAVVRQPHYEHRAIVTVQLIGGDQRIAGEGQAFGPTSGAVAMPGGLERAEIEALGQALANFAVSAPPPDIEAWLARNPSFRPSGGPKPR